MSWGPQAEIHTAIDPYKMKITPGLPRPPRYPNEPVAIDLEVFEQEQGRIHRPTGHFACLAVSYPETKDHYVIETLEDLRVTLNERLADASWILHNALYDIKQLQRWVTIPRRLIWDTMVIEKTLFGGWYDTFGLDALHRRWLGTKLKKTLRSEFATTNKLTNPLRQYAARDAASTGRIYLKQREYIDKEDIDLKHYWVVEEPAIWAIIDILPVKVEVDAWLRMASGFKAQATKIENFLGFNPRSADQVKAAIYRTAKRRVKNTRAKTTLEPLLAELKEKDLVKHESAIQTIQAILDARMYGKASSTYGSKWIRDYVEDGDLVYAGWWVCGAPRTSRMSASNPNLQNIPIRRMPQYRERFISQWTQGLMLISDVQQQETRILAHFSQDQALIAALRAGEDTHQTVATACNVSRRRGKAVNLGMPYGLSAYGLARDTGMPKEEAASLLATYFARFRGVQKYMNDMRSTAWEDLYVANTLGRRTWINPHHDGWKNIAVNAPIQGTAAAHTKLALSILHRECALNNLLFPVCLVVHDEICLDIPRGYMAQYRKLTKDAWIEAGKKVIPGIPIKIDMVSGKSWGAK